MVWQGGPGVGKSTTIEILAKYGFAQVVFLRTEDTAHIVRTVKEALTLCPRSLFVLDDADVMPQGAINALTPFFSGKHVQLARAAAFVFVINIGLRATELFVAQHRALFDMTHFSTVRAAVQTGSRYYLSQLQKAGYGAAVKYENELFKNVTRVLVDARDALARFKEPAAAADTAESLSDKFNEDLDSVKRVHEDKMRSHNRKLIELEVAFADAEHVRAAMLRDFLPETHWLGRTRELVPLERRSAARLSIDVQHKVKEAVLDAGFNDGGDGSDDGNSDRDDSDNSRSGQGAAATFFNTLVTRSLLSVWVPFLPIAPEGYSCCILLQMRNDFTAKARDDRSVCSVSTPDPYSVAAAFAELPHLTHTGFLRGGCRSAKDEVGALLGRMSDVIAESSAPGGELFFARKLAGYKGKANSEAEEQCVEVVVRMDADHDVVSEVMRVGPRSALGPKDGDATLKDEL